MTSHDARSSLVGGTTNRRRRIEVRTTLSDLARLDVIRELADTATPAWVVIGLSQTRYFGAAFIGFLMATTGRLKDRGQRPVRHYRSVFFRNDGSGLDDGRYSVRSV